MKIAIIGSRNFKDKMLLKEHMQKFQEQYNITHIVSGGAKGADTLAVEWADENSIETIVFYPDASKHKGAYYARNKQIVNESDIIVAFWDGTSTGTKYTIDFARSKQKEVVIVEV